MKGSIGIDEVGRGPLAGPVTVCACFVEDENEVKQVIFGNTVRDSKKIQKSLRNNIYLTIRQNRLLKTKIKYVVSSRSATYIDTYGISKAVQACLLTCLNSLLKQGVDITKIPIRLDAGLKVPLNNVQQESFVKGDERFTEIALASIIAKVTRDTYMERLAKTHHEYGWEKNVGYGTKTHRDSIRKNGITKYHRKSYLKAFKQFDKTE